jgi:enamine deaminase RidA (YjgF/YER057c/UK114 family)
MSVEWRMVERGRMAWVSGIAPEPPGDVQAQSRRILGRIVELLAGAGYDKSRILTAGVSLEDMALLEAHNAVWESWVDPHRPPVRTLKAAKLARPGSLVRIEVTAAK